MQFTNVTRTRWLASMDLLLQACSSVAPPSPLQEAQKGSVASIPLAPLVPMKAQLMRAVENDTQGMWRDVVDTIEKTVAQLAAISANVELGPLQALLAAAGHELIPKLRQLGPLGIVCQQRLEVLMQEAGLAPGAQQPALSAALRTAAANALTAMKTTAVSSMLAPIVLADAPAPMAAAAMPTVPSPSRALHALPVRPATQLVSPLDQNGRVVCGLVEGGEDSGESGEGSSAPKLHACKRCQRAKTACDHKRPCSRCVRLGAPCDDVVCAGSQFRPFPRPHPEAQRTARTPLNACVRVHARAARSSRPSNARASRAAAPRSSATSTTATPARARAVRTLAMNVSRTCLPLPPPGRVSAAPPRRWAGWMECRRTRRRR